MDEQFYKARPLGPGEPEDNENGDGEGFDVGWTQLDEWEKPPTVEITDYVGTNDVRAWRGGQVMIAYAKLSGRDEFQSTLGDMLSDLHHFADAVGVDFAACAYRGEDYHGDEIRGIL